MEQENSKLTSVQAETKPDTEKESEETIVSVNNSASENQESAKDTATNENIENETESAVNDNKQDLDIDNTDKGQIVSDLKGEEDAVDAVDTADRDDVHADDADDDDLPPPPPHDDVQAHEEENKSKSEDADFSEPEPEPVGPIIWQPDPEPEPPEPEVEPWVPERKAVLPVDPEPEPEPEPEIRASLQDEPEERCWPSGDLPEPEPEPGIGIHRSLSDVNSPAHDYHPRLCHLIKRADFNGYGFNLHGEKDVQGQYIGLVDDNSPADRAGLKKGDRIIEVNGENTESSTHQEVIMRIKSGGDETKLLVVDKATDDYYKNNGLKIDASLPEVVYKSSETKDTTEMTFTPRYCHIIKWPDFNGYGFNLHAEKERGGQYIGKIDDNSPAQDGGLKERDRIIEVNGVNVEDLTHREVIAKIKEGGDETKLLVVDPEADNFFKSRGVTVSSTMPGVKFIETTRKSPAGPGVTNGDSTPTRTEAVPNSAPPVQANGGGDFLSLNLSAKEMRERIASKKKVDPKQKSNMDFKTKYDMFQKL